MYITEQFQPKKAGHNFVLIRIDRIKQETKRYKLGNLFVPPGLIHMQHNQQVGEILLVGDNIQDMFPDMEAGDELFFHHSVEGSIMSPEERKKFAEINNWCVYDNPYLDPYRYYVVRENFIYGYRKKGSGIIIMHPDMCFAIASHEEEDDRDLKKVGSLLMFVNFKEERADIEVRIKAMKMECETHPERALHLMPEMEKLTRSLSKRRAGTFMPVFTGQNIQDEFMRSVVSKLKGATTSKRLDTTWMIFYEFLGSKSTVPQVTTITIDDYIFYVLRKDYILMAKKPKKIKTNAITLTSVLNEYEKTKAELNRKRLLGTENIRIAPGLLHEPQQEASSSS